MNLTHSWITRSLMTVLTGIALSFSACAAETRITPGTGRLQQAVSAGSSGDILLLEDGSYTGDLAIDKSLNLLGVDGDARIMTKGIGVVISGSDTRVVMEGLAVAEPLSLDVTGNGRIDALSDGLLIFRFLNGRRDYALVSNAVPGDSVRKDTQEITLYLEQLAAAGILDVDANGKANAQTDGTLAIRHMFGFRGSALTQNAVATDATQRSAEEIDEFLRYFYPD